MLLKIGDIKLRQPVYFMGYDGRYGIAMISEVTKPAKPEEIPGSGSIVAVTVVNMAGSEIAKLEGHMAPNGFVYFNNGENWLRALSSNEQVDLSHYRLPDLPPAVKLAD